MAELSAQSEALKKLVTEEAQGLRAVLEDGGKRICFVMVMVAEVGSETGIVSVSATRAVPTKLAHKWIDATQVESTRMRLALSK